jgi:hypothetical protein
VLHRTPPPGVGVRWPKDEDIISWLRSMIKTQANGFSGFVPMQSFHARRNGIASNTTTALTASGITVCPEGGDVMSRAGKKGRAFSHL